MDLAGIGATGCLLHTRPLIIYTLAKGRAPFAGMAFFGCHLHIPYNEALKGMQIVTQVVADETLLPVAQRSNPSGLTTSDAVCIEIDSSAPSIGMSTVSGFAGDETGIVSTAGAPIMRRIYQ